MDVIDIEYTDDISGDLERRLTSGLWQYEKENNINTNYRQFVFSAIDESGNIIGKLLGYTVFEEVYIYDTLSNQSISNKNLCKELIKEVENQFLGKGYNNINLSTIIPESYQLYVDCGFELEFVRENKKDQKFNKYFFIKRF